MRRSRRAGKPRVITGPIDSRQVRPGAVHVLDCKPDVQTDTPIAQLAICALALIRRTPGFKLFDITGARFNQNDCCKFFSCTLLVPHGHLRFDGQTL